MHKEIKNNILKEKKPNKLLNTLLAGLMGFYTLLPINLFGNCYDDYKRMIKEHISKRNYSQAVQTIREGQKYNCIPKSDEWNRYISNLESKILQEKTKELNIKNINNLYLTNESYLTNNNSGMIALLLMADLGLTGFTTIKFAEAEAYAKDYNDKHAEIDNTTQENAELLKTLRSDVEKRQNEVKIYAAISSAFLLYTALDYFFFHTVFQDNTANNVEITNNNGVIKITYNIPLK